MMGFPPRVFSWAPSVQSIISPLAAQTPMGRPAATDLLMHMMSSSMSQCSHAHILPVLPKPV